MVVFVKLIVIKARKSLRCSILLDFSVEMIICS